MSLKTEYAFIRFVEKPKPENRKTATWSCVNVHHGGELGVVMWYGAWRQFCFFPTMINTVFSAGCLADIQDFIKQLMQQRKDARHV